ncbi:hypothetical protein LKD70_10945 [Ruminococcus sp. CLA-AA-H200]|uniref:Uncharacterized protein n=1 Tax=Ruminococcus turbiniformis TaxID=2881258 RepID=A0ABS8FXZ4_9FIRM|nr:hypothetical protein [Ruminococcus turbiniformis]MCC2254928.1 hypothetical protein [Ruminococcus turbiniformis]
MQKYGIMRVFANSAQSDWSGTDAYGVVSGDGDCPVVVENEKLTFDISEFPQMYYSSLDEYLAYPGRVNAEYTFYNPSDDTVRAVLMFPFGQSPDYGYTYDDAAETAYPAADAENLEITVNGAPIEKKLRLTWAGGGEFDLEKGLERLRAETDGDSFYSPDLPVVRYTYKISGIDEEKYDAASAGAVIRGDGTRTKLFFENMSGYARKEDGAEISAWAQNGETLSVYVLGEEPGEMPEWYFCSDGSMEERIDGEALLTGTEQLTMEEFVRMICPSPDPAYETDLYHAVTEALTVYEQDCGVIMSDFFSSSRYLMDSLMRWYEYEITLGPGERIVNRVEAPVYPAVQDADQTPEYTYTYLLSPAQTWNGFGTLEISVNTPYFMTESNMGEGETRQEGYTFSFDSLPEGEFVFTLSESEQAAGEDGFLSHVLEDQIFPGAVSVLLGAAAITAVILAISHRQKGKRR